MKSDRIVQAPQEAAYTGITVAPPSVREYAMLDELSFVRREAQAEANVAYADWLVQPCGERYVVFRAAQDRADAAQDQLAEWALRLRSAR